MCAQHNVLYERVAGRQLRASGRGRGAVVPDIADGLGLWVETLCLRRAETAWVKCSRQGRVPEVGWACSLEAASQQISRVQIECCTIRSSACQT